MLIKITNVVFTIGNSSDNVFVCSSAWFPGPYRVGAGINPKLHLLMRRNTLVSHVKLLGRQEATGDEKRGQEARIC